MTANACASERSDLTPIEVQRRFDWALRTGNPRWLWPDLRPDEWQKALIAIEQAIRDILGGAAEVHLKGDPHAVGIACYTSGCGPLLGHWLERQQLVASKALAAVLECHLNHNARRMHAMANHATEVVGEFQRRGIEVTILKGMHTAYQYFADPACRPMSDIDLLIDPADEYEATQALRDMDFEPGAEASVPRQRTWRKSYLRPEPRSLCFTHAEDPWAIDLQMSLNRRYSAGAPIVRLDDVDAKEHPHRNIAVHARTLPQPLLAIQLACHAASGLVSLTLLRLTELVLVIRQDAGNGSLCWDEFIAEADRSGALGHMYPALHFCEELAPGTIPSCVLHASERETPHAVRRMIGGLRPATAARLTRCSLAERYMWTVSFKGYLRQFAADIFLPGSSSVTAMMRVYRQRAWRLAKGTITLR